MTAHICLGWAAPQGAALPIRNDLSRSRAIRVGCGNVGDVTFPMISDGSLNPRQETSTNDERPEVWDPRAALCGTASTLSE